MIKINRIHYDSNTYRNDEIVVNRDQPETKKCTQALTEFSSEIRNINLTD